MIPAASRRADDVFWNVAMSTRRTGLLATLIGLRGNGRACV
ncbi:hypothetical protein [Tessaracoccus flavescens]|nr:hypothetical protein [Tessaracoccus flavescens]